MFFTNFFLVKNERQIVKNRFYFGKKKKISSFFLGSCTIRRLGSSIPSFAERKQIGARPEKESKTKSKNVRPRHW